jgi:hypothetical protein
MNLGSGGSKWIPFDFEDITIIPGEKYYIIWKQHGAGDQNSIYWLFGDNDPYKNGKSWEYYESWSELELKDHVDIDCCFKTYGLDQPPNSPSITGPHSGYIGHVYDFQINATDPEDHYISYFVDWGDGSNTGWFGPFPSGTMATVPHSWDAEQIYSFRVKVKDQYDAESDWTIHEVSIPINKIGLAFYTFVKNHSYLYALL